MIAGAKRESYESTGIRGTNTKTTKRWRVATSNIGIDRFDVAKAAAAASAISLRMSRKSQTQGTA